MGDAEASVCVEILRSLPDWFGIEEAILQYGRDIEIMDTSVAQADGRIAGFITLNQHNPFTAEIHVLAVRETYHRRGIGRRLVQSAEHDLTSRSIEYLEVKTLGPSKASTHYHRTRQFYSALGFRPIEETNLWGLANPCLIMVKHLPCRP